MEDSYNWHPALIPEGPPIHSGPSTPLERMYFARYSEQVLSTSGGKCVDDNHNAYYQQPDTAEGNSSHPLRTAAEARRCGGEQQPDTVERRSSHTLWRRAAATHCGQDQQPHTAEHLSDIIKISVQLGVFCGFSLCNAFCPGTDISTVSLIVLPLSQALVIKVG